MSDDSGSNIDMRLSKVEQQIAGLASTVESLSDSVNQSNRQISQLANDTRSTMEKRMQTPWSPLLGAAGLIIAVLGSLFSVVSLNQDKRTDKIEQVVTSLSGAFHDHEKSFGHLAISQKVIDHNKEISSLDVSLQREMRLLNAELKATIVANEKRLQEEMVFIKENNELRSQGLNNIQVQQIKELQRIVFGGVPD